MRRASTAAYWQTDTFLLTHLMRGATGVRRIFISTAWIFLLTHLMRGATGGLAAGMALASDISTHAPHARCDTKSAVSNAGTWQFLLTHLMRGATCWTRQISGLWRKISTHAPHARCDQIAKDIDNQIALRNFYSRTSCEVRLFGDTSLMNDSLNFYSRTSCEVRPFKNITI